MVLEGFSIKEQPERVQLMLLGLIIALLYLVVSQQLIKPVQAEIDTLQNDIQGLTTQVYQGKIAATRLPDLEKEIAQREATLSQLREILPEQKETAEIIRNIQRLAVAANLKIKSFIPQKTVQNDFYEDWPIVISMEGTYDNLGVFFQSVGQFTRIINVDNITIKEAENPGPRNTIGATCTATTFVFLEEAPTS